MGIIILLLISSILLCFVLIILSYKMNQLPIQGKKEKIREKLRENLVNYNKNKNIELVSNYKADRFNSVRFLFFLVPIVVGLMPEMNLKEGAYILIFIYLILCIVIYFYKRTTFVKKIILKKDRIEFYCVDNKCDIYNLNEIDVNYKIITDEDFHTTHYIYIDDKKYDIAGGIRGGASVETHVAFVLFANLLKEQKIDKIEYLEDKDIRGLQKDVIYRG